ncbi:hypothetical protein AURDEDRAFT_116836 [Auricularia subglabra TFB-10046 SS5]|nr:hypothetical protein AURDEDRAFT_116836 [Auricularia subglabra TFB-10046 SS5]
MTGSATPTRDALRALLSSFVPSCSLETRSKGYRDLALLVEKQPGRLGTPAKPLIEDAFRSATQDSALSALTFLAALFQTDNVSASAVLLDDGVFQSVAEVLDLYSASPDILCALASLLSQASAHKACREPIAAAWLSWLQESAQQTSHPRLRAAAACALTKLYIGARDANPADQRVHEGQAEALVSLLKALLAVVPAGDETAVSDTVEALAYITSEPAAKEAFARDVEALARVLSFVPRKGDAAPAQPILYGAAVFLRNLAAYRPQASDEEEQIAKLRRMTREGAALSPEGRMAEQAPDARDDAPAVLARCRRLIDAGAISALSSISRYARESPRIGRLVSETLLALVEDKADRGKVLQGGAAKTLLALTRISFSVLSASGSGEPPSRALINIDPADLLAAQALAKLAITSPPLAVFGPGDAGALDALRPLDALLLHPSATRLQTFEGLMALTNLASAGAALAERIAAFPGLAGRLETLLLDDHDLVRRAAAELTCNLLGSSGSACERVVAARNRLDVLLALADVDDVPTRSACAGALACVAHDPRAAKAVLEKPANVARLITSGDEGLVHRGAVIILGALEGLDDGQMRTFATSLDGEGVTSTLVSIVKRGPSAGPLLGPTVEVLKLFSSLGITIPAS